MAQYIEKSALVAEIESKKKHAQILGDNAINGSMQQFYDGMKQGCVDILSFLDTIEVKEIGVDVGSPEGNLGRKTVQVIDADGNISEVTFDKAQKGEEV